MKTALAIGDERRLAGYGLAGAVVCHAATAADAAAVLAAVDDDVGLLILTPEAADALREPLGGRDDLVWVVLPS